MGVNATIPSHIRSIVDIVKSKKAHGRGRARRFPSSQSAGMNESSCDKPCFNTGNIFHFPETPTTFFPPSPTPTLFNTPTPPSVTDSLASPTPTLIASPSPLRLVDFSIIGHLGKGSSGDVLLAKHRPSARLVALKVVKKHIERNVWARGEQEAMRRVREAGVKGVVRMLGSFEDGDTFVFVIEYYPGESLAKELRACKRFSPERAQFITASLVSTLSSLHKARILHRDIKPGNILFTASGAVVLADFGLSVVFEDSEEELTTGDAGTWAFMAPEMFVGEMYGYEVDFWAVGVVLYLMLTGKVPFGRRTRCIKDLVDCIMHDPLLFSTRIDAVTQDLLKKLLARNPDDRLRRVEDIKAHAYFRNINWNTFRNEQYSVRTHDSLLLGRETIYVGQKDIRSIPFTTKPDWDGSEYPDFYYISPELAHEDTFKGASISDDMATPADSKYPSIGRMKTGDSNRRERRWYQRLFNVAEIQSTL